MNKLLTEVLSLFRFPSFYPSRVAHYIQLCLLRLRVAVAVSQTFLCLNGWGRSGEGWAGTLEDGLQLEPSFGRSDQGFLMMRLGLWVLRRTYNTFLKCKKLDQTKQMQNVNYVKQRITKFILVCSMNRLLLMK